MPTSLRRLLVCAATVTLASSVHARQAADDGSYIAVISAEKAPVRAGADEGYYPVAWLERGQLVQVDSEKADWARVRLVGPSFPELFGYLKFEKSLATTLRIASDGRSGMTLGPTAVHAPNVKANMDARDSWKTIATLDTGATVTILDTFETELDKVYKIVMPADAHAYISLGLLERATPDQVDAWHRALAAPTPTAPAQPKSPAPAATPPTRDDTPPAIDQAPGTPAQSQPPAATQPPAERPAVEANAAPLAIEEPLAAPAVEPAPPATPEETLKQLDAALQRLASEPLAQAEVEPLRNLYQDLARRAGENTRVQRYADIRAAQLQVWIDLQEHRRRLADLRARVEISAEETASARLNFEATGRYTAVGRLLASTIYSGQGLPRLLRLQDPATGRTLAYLRPSKEFDLIGLLNQVIGVVGTTTYDPGLRLQIIEPRRVDILAPQQSSM